MIRKWLTVGGVGLVALWLADATLFAVVWHGLWHGLTTVVGWLHTRFTKR